MALASISLLNKSLICQIPKLAVFSFNPQVTDEGFYALTLFSDFLSFHHFVALNFLLKHYVSSLYLCENCSVFPPGMGTSGK